MDDDLLGGPICGEALVSPIDVFLQLAQGQVTAPGLQFEDVAPGFREDAQAALAKPVQRAMLRSRALSHHARKSPPSDFADRGSPSLVCRNVD
jgi:hypothetical protein